MKSGAVSVDSVELTVSESEKDTAALVTKSGCDAPGPVGDTREQNKLQQQTIFQILCLASATVFGSLASVVFFLNLFFVTIGTNVVEGLVREKFTFFAVFIFRECQSRFSCFSKMISGQAVRFLVGLAYLRSLVALPFCSPFSFQVGVWLLQ